MYDVVTYQNMFLEVIFILFYMILFTFTTCAVIFQDSIFKAIKLNSMMYVYKI